MTERRLEATYGTMRATMVAALNDLDILAGNDVADAPWQTVAKSAAINLRSLAAQLDHVRAGAASISFPCPHECLACRP